MNYNKKIRIIALVAFLIACFSLGIGYSSLNTTLEITGTANVVKKEWKVKIDNIHDIVMSEGTASFLRQPIITDDITVNCAVNLKQSSSEVSFSFNILNEGNIDGLVDKITINGLENYESYVEYKIDGIKENDKILKGEKIEDIKITLKYKDILEDSMLLEQEINLNNLNVIISFKQL